MIVIETDLEPDDLITIYQIIQSKPIEYPFTFVVGEGSSRFKEKLLRVFLSTFLSPSSQIYNIIQGIDSPEPYPIDHLPKEWLILDEISNLPLSIRLLQYKTLYKTNKIKECYFLKPPREALLLKNDLKNCFQTISCFAYGGFNYRVITNNIEEINQLATCFKQYYHFSRKMELEFGKDLYLLNSLLNRQDSFALFLKICIKNWNLHYIERFQPNLEIKSKIMENVSIQFVMADVLCATVPEKLEFGMLIDEDRVLMGGEKKIVCFSGMSRDVRNQQVRKSLDALFEKESISSKQSFL